MDNLSKAIGMKCIFENSDDVLEFCRFSNMDFGSHYFSVMDDYSVLSKGTWTEIPERFQPSYFETLIQKFYTIEAIVLHLYPAGVIPEEIDFYQDFVQSNCELILLIWDVAYVDIYCKNEEWLRTLLSNAEQSPNAHISMKTVDTDDRTSMHVW